MSYIPPIWSYIQTLCRICFPLAETSHSFFTSTKKRKTGSVVIPPQHPCLFSFPLYSFSPPWQFWHHVIRHLFSFLSCFTHKLHRCVYATFPHLLFSRQFATLLVLAMDAIPAVEFRCRLFINRHPATFTLAHFLLFVYLYPVSLLCIFNVQFQAQFLCSRFEIAFNASMLKILFTYRRQSFFYEIYCCRQKSVSLYV